MNNKIDVDFMFPCTVGDLIAALEQVDHKMFVYMANADRSEYFNPMAIDVYDDHAVIYEENDETN